MNETLHLHDASNSFEQFSTIESSIDLPSANLTRASNHPRIQDARVTGSVEKEKSEPKSGSAGVCARTIDLALSLPLLR